MSDEATVNRVLDALERLAREPAGLALTVIAQELGLAKSATYRLLSGLQNEHCVVQDPHSQFYRMTMRIPILGFRYLSATGIVDACQPHLDRLAARTGELVRMTVAECGNLTWIAKSQGAKSELRFDPEMGRDVRLHTTATGKVWLASLPRELGMRIVRERGFGARGDFGPNALDSMDELVKALEETRERGYGMGIDEDEPGMSAIAAAIRPANRAHVVGTVSVAGPSVRLSPQRLKLLAKDLLATAKELAAVWPQHADGDCSIITAAPPTDGRARAPRRTRDSIINKQRQRLSAA